MMRAPSLTRRLILALVAFQLVASIGAATVGTLLYWLLEHNMGEGVRAAEAVAAAIGADDNGALVLSRSELIDPFRMRSAAFWFIADDGRRRLTGGAPPPLEVSNEPVDGGPETMRFLRGLLHDPLGVSVTEPFGTAAGPLTITVGGIATPWRDVIADLTRTTQDLAVWILLPLAIGTTVLVPWLARSVLGRIRRVAAAAEAIDPGNRGQRLPDNEVPRELLPLVRAVNSALARLDDGYERQRRFVADAAHELRTPIAILRIRLDALQPGHLKDRLLLDARRLSGLADQLLELERLRGSLAGRVAVDLVRLAHDVTADMAPQAVEAGYTIEFGTEAERIEVNGDEAALRRAIGNLIANAIEHGGRRGAIEVTVSMPGAVEVADAGPGVPPAMRKRIFEPFFRGSRTGPGAGLGLHLVREIMRAHQGRAELVERLGAGARFRIAFGAPMAGAQGHSDGRA